MQQEDKEASGDEDAADGDSVGGLATPASQGPVDALRFGAEGGKESAFFQDSGAVPTKLEQEEREVGVCACVCVSVCYTCFLFDIGSRVVFVHAEKKVVCCWGSRGLMERGSVLEDRGFVVVRSGHVLVVLFCVVRFCIELCGCCMSPPPPESACIELLG